MVSSTMNLIQDSEGDHLTAYAIKKTSSGTKILSNNMILNNFSSSSNEQYYLPNKYKDLTAVSDNVKDILQTVDDEEYTRMISDMVGDHNTLQDSLAVGNIQQSLVQEQGQLLESYNGKIDLPQDIQMQAICISVDKKEPSDVNNQQIHKSHILPWLSEDYTKLMQPNKHNHVVTIKKDGPLKVKLNKKHSTILSHDLSTTEFVSKNDIYLKNKCNMDEKQKIYEKTLSSAHESKDQKEIYQKNYVSIVRDRDIKKESLQSNKEVCSEWKESTRKTIPLENMQSSTDVLSPKDSEIMINNLPCIHPSQTQNIVHKSDNLSEISMSYSNEHIMIPQFLSMPILLPGELIKTKPCPIIDNQTTDHHIMIQELNNMVPSNVYSHQTLKTFDNGEVLLVAPLSVNGGNTQRKLLKPKKMGSTIKSEIKNTSMINEIKVNSSDIKPCSLTSDSIYKQDKTVEYYDTKTNCVKKIKTSHDFINYDMAGGIEKKVSFQYEDKVSNFEKKRKRMNMTKAMEKKKWQLEDEFSDAEEEKKRINARKAKDHREKKKVEIKELKKESMQWQLKYKELEAENKQLKSQIEMLRSLFNPIANTKIIH